MDFFFHAAAAQSLSNVLGVGKSPTREQFGISKGEICFSNAFLKLWIAIGWR